MTELKSNFYVIDKDSFNNKVDELIRRYKVEITKVWGDVEIREDEDYDGIKFKYQVYPVEVTFSFGEFKIDGYQYLGCIKDEERLGFVTIHGNDNLEGHDIQEWVKSFDGIPCSACNRKHSRKIGHLFLEEETNEVKVFGSGCAKKYFGINFDRILGFYENFQIRYDEWEMGFRTNFFGSLYTTQTVIENLYWSIDKYGYVSKSKAYEMDTESTADDVRGVLIEKCYPKTLKEVTKDINFYDIFDLVYEGDNDFTFNMNTIKDKIEETGVVSLKDLGYVAFMVFDKWFRVPPQEKIDFVHPEGVEVKQRLRGIDAELVSCNYYDGNWGRVYNNIFIDKENKVKYVWSSNKSLKSELDVEELPVNIHVKGATVKELVNHVDYGKSVKVNRVIAEKV